MSTTRERSAPRLLQALALAVLLSLGAGCAHLLVPNDEIAPSVQAALERQDYDVAAALLRRLPASDPARDGLTARFHDASAAYGREVAARAIAEANRGRWVEAFAVLDEGRARWRNSAEIADASRLLKEREARLYRRLHAELLLAEAQWLASRRKHTGELERLHRRDAKRLAATWERRAARLSKQLRQLAERCVEAEEWKGARRLLLAASELGGTDVSAQLASLQDHEASGTGKGGSSGSGSDQATRAHRTRAEKLLREYEASGAMADLIAARKHIFSHNASGQLDTHAARLEDLSRRRFRQGMQAGDQHYAAGRYREARDTWAAALELYPDDEELRKKLERAEKVLRNLEALSQTQGR